MAMLAEVFGPASTLKIQAYWMALLHYHWADVEFAAMRCVETRRSSGGYPAPWPSPADLIGLMWNDQEATPDTQPVPVRKALPEPRCTPEVAKEHLTKIYALLDKTAGKMPEVRAERTDEVSGRPYREIVEQERWVMTESNWRARWELGKIDPQYRRITEAIPERLRVQFAVEDQLEEERRAEATKPRSEPQGERGKAVPF
jgi:hypothetical protein